MAPRKDLTLEKKIEILNSTSSKIILAKQYDVNLATIYRICQNKEKLKEQYLQNKSLSKKRFRNGIYTKTEKALLIWFKNIRSKNGIINGPVMLNKAIEYAKLFNEGVPDASWLQRFRHRENITFQKISNERGGADSQGATHWINQVLPSLLSQYKKENIYNADETGLFYQALLDGTMNFKEEPLDKKAPKNRITLLLIANADGSKKYIYAIGKFKSPRCFKNVNIPITYYHNKNAWMTATIFMDILKKLDRCLNKDILLFVDNASCHKLDCNFNHIKLHFLPTTTSFIQPLDMGIIRSFKNYYRRLLMQKMVYHLDNAIEFEIFFNLLDAIYLVKKSWNLVTTTTIINCFVKSKFFKSTIIKEEDEEPNLISFEDDEISCYGDINDDDICTEISELFSREQPEIDIEEEELEMVENIPTKEEAQKAYFTWLKYAHNVVVNQDKIREYEDYIEANIF